LGAGKEKILSPSSRSVACSAAIALRYLAVSGGELLLIGGKLVDCLAYNDEIKRYRLELLGQFCRTCVCGG